MTGKLYNGRVNSYNPSTRVYSVNVTGLGDRFCRRLHNGVDRPYPDRKLVVCAQVYDSSWIIIGELESPAVPAGTNRPTTTDESAAAFVNNLTELNTRSPSLDVPQFRDPEDEIHFAGDASIENRTDDPKSRSKIKIYSYGAILTFASNFCFQMFNRRDNKILTTARSFVTRSVGYFKSIIFNTKTNTTTIYEQLQSNPIEQDSTGQPAAKNDRESYEGVIPVIGNRAKYGTQLIRAPKVERGRRDMYGDHRVEERDNKTHSYRERQDSITYAPDGTEKTRNTEIYKEEGRIVSGSGAVSYGSRVFYRDWLVIEINNETNSVRIEDLKRSQKIEMSSTGVFIKGSNVSIDGDVIKLTATSAIHLDTPALIGTNLTTALFETPTGSPMLSLNSSGGGYFDLSMYKGILLDGYTKLVSLDLIPKGFSVLGFLRGFKSKIGFLKKLLGSVKSAAQSLLGDRASLLKEISGGLTPPDISGLAGGLTPPDISGLAGGLTPPDIGGLASGLTPPNISPPNLSNLTPPLPGL